MVAIAVDMVTIVVAMADEANDGSEWEHLSDFLEEDADEDHAQRLLFSRPRCESRGLQPVCNHYSSLRNAGR